MDQWDWALTFPLIVKWVVILGSLFGLWIWYFMSTLTDEECEQIGYRRRRYEHSNTESR
jgi:hypothetical protein